MQKISNAEIKKIRSLAQKKFRDGYGLFVAEGEKMVAEAMASGFGVTAVYRRDEIGEEAMGRISQLAAPSPVLAVVRKPTGLVLEDEYGFREALGLDKKSGQASGSGKGGLFLLLDTIRDPGNLGTILRVADWFGVDAVFASRDTVDIFNPKVVQATMGAVFRVRFHYADLPALCRTALSAGGRVYGTFLDGNDIYSSSLATGEDFPVLAVTGNESEGISREVEALCSDRLYIPPYPAGEPGSESLNAAIATAVTLAEFRRRARRA